MVAFAAVGGILISLGSISEPSIHSTATVSLTPQERAYLDRLREHGVRGGSLFLLKEGRKVCDDFRADPDLTREEEVARSGLRLGREDDAPQIVDATLIHICDGQGL